MSCPAVQVPVKKNVIVIGAGASGLFCAAQCGGRGRSVLVLDHADRICSKVLISGGGRCNFTNLHVAADHYLSANPHFCRSALARFTPQDMLDLLKKHRVACYEKEAGRMFCARSSHDIVNLLKHECEKANVEIRLKTGITSVKKESCFIVAAGEELFHSDSLVVATGGLSYENLGATGFGHTLARRFGLNVTDLRPALVPLTFSPHDQKLFRGLAGISLDSAISCGGRNFRGSILFTHNGLSGPAVLQASSYWKKGTPVAIDLLPGIDAGAALSDAAGKTELKNMLARHLPKRFAERWCELFFPSKPVNQYSEKELRSLGERLHAWEIKPAATGGYARAEATAGGVDTKGISSKTMEAGTVSGLYFTGEVLDVTGQLGGYNLHWAWASGYAAGQYA